MKLANIADSKSAAPKGLWVQVPPPAPYMLTKTLNPDKNLQSYIIGLALGDGNLSNPNGRATVLRITCATRYQALLTKIKRALADLLPDNKIGQVKRESNCVDVVARSNYLEGLLGWKVKGGSKFVQQVGVPDWIFTDESYMIQCLCGLIETDGSIYTDRGYKMVMFVSVIPRLAEDVQRLITFLGFASRIYRLDKSRLATRKMFNIQHLYHVRLSKDVHRFLELVQPLKA
jgi:hypothetical protein